MWCGCTAKARSGSNGPRPFSTDDGETGPAAPSSLLHDDNHDVWSKMKQLVPAPHPKVQGVVINSETVLFDLRTGQCHRLNVKETAIWEACTGSATLHDIVQTVSSRLDVPVELMHERVMVSIAQWSHDGLLVQAEPHGGNLPAAPRLLRMEHVHHMEPMQR